VIIGGILLPLGGSVAAGAERIDAANPQINEQKITAEELATWIDRHFENAWKHQGIEPAAITSDSEFVRRAYLDLIGRIPSVAEVRAFLDDRSPDKRRQLIDELLQRGAFANHLASTFRDLMLAGAMLQAPQTRTLEVWLKLRFTANMPYDQVVRELLTAEIDRNPSLRTPSPIAFYQAADFKPETLAANASRIFMGIQVQCAQCHDHPFAEWKQAQFWSFAAFFKNVDSQQMTGVSMTLTPEAEQITIPGKEIVVPALFLDGSKPVRAASESSRAMLARWITASDNPYFAKAAVNRIWGRLLGHGFVQPVDDLDPTHTPAYPEVFNAICRQFRLHQYDVKYVIRAVTATRVYQLSCRGAPRDGEDPLSPHFARMPLRRMTSDQIYASFVQATGFRDTTTNLGETVARNEFQEKFADSATSPTEIKTTILQALSLMNGSYITGATDLQNSEFLSVVADAPYLDAKGRIETLFLATLSRPPDANELTLFLVSQNPAEEKNSLADLFWMLLNSAEFILNH
jgi:hypothetical protein